MALLSFISMYFLMYLMVDSYSNVYMNLNQVYMAGIMTVPMIFIELLLMNSMYPNKKLNTVLIGASLATLIALLFLLRKQIAITDKEFLKSMIPHHAAALLMCHENHLQDPDLKKLCNTISATQQHEIDFMKSKLVKHG